ncbi:MAG: RhuM family protein [Actinomycetota bacterium]|nr:RhuM family protein [Actinomycetota bacterium]
MWASQAQIVDLFGLNVSSVSRHINNIFRDSEVDRESNLQKVQIATSDRPVTLYSLDLILAVGYRANSSRAIQFRRWANEVLKDHLIKGLTLNDRRLEQLGSIVQVLSRSDNELISGVADVLASYVPGLRLLREYDDGAIEVPEGAAPGWELRLDEARSVVARVAAEFPEDSLVGLDPEGRLDSSIAALYQSFEGHDMYPTAELKAANLLYLVVKDHPLKDGNKRSAAALFVTFLARNGLLINADGQPKFTNNALAALTLMVAMSDPAEKDLMVALITKMLAGS